MLRRGAWAGWVLLPALASGCRGPSGDSGPSTSADAAPNVAPAPPPSVPVNVTPMSAASIEAFVNPGHVPPYDGPTGSLEGRITVTGDPAPDVAKDFSKCPAARDVYGKLFRDGPPDATGARPLADVLVAVTDYTGFVAEGREAKAVSIENCAFSARTLDMTVGQRLEVTNHGDLLIAPALAKSPLPALMIATPHADPVKLYPQKPGYDTLVDRTGPGVMSADVYVLAFPFHTVSGLDGHYRIDGIPVGKAKVSARLAAIQNEASKPIEVKANVVQIVDLTLIYPSPQARPAATAGRADAGLSPNRPK